MKTKFKLSVIGASLMMAYATSYAEDGLSEVEQLIRPESSVSVGVGVTNGDRQQFGRFDGVTDSETKLLLDADISKRDEATGTWTRFKARDLGLESRELGASYDQQGNWGVAIDYSRIPSQNPLKFITGATGIGSTTMTYGGVGVTTATAASSTATSAAAAADAQAKLYPANREVDLSMHRDLTSLSFYKFLSNEVSFNFVFKNEEKNGERLWGRGSNIEFAVEPIDSVTRQLEAFFNFTGEELQLSGGLSASWYKNHNDFLDTVGGSAVNILPVALTGAGYSRTNGHTFLSLPLDNEAYQLYVNGNYNLTKTTRATFKASYTRATQDASLNPITSALINSGAMFTNGVVGSPPSSLDGRVDTTLIELGLTSKPIDKLSMIANVRYQDRDDKTPVKTFADYWSFSCTGTTSGQRFSGTSAVEPIAGTNCSLYIPAALAATYTALGTVRGAANAPTNTVVENNPRDFKNLAGKLEATYRLPMGYSLTAGYNYDRRERSFEIDPVAGEYEGVVKMRKVTEENAYSLKLRGTLLEQEHLSGGLIYQHAKRDGSNWHVAEGAAFAAQPLNYVNPTPFTDRTRDKWRLTLDWEPVSNMSFQFNYETNDDDYNAGKSGEKSGKADLISLDGSFVLNDDWQMNAWLSHDTSKRHQTGYTYDTRTTLGATTFVNWCSTTAPITLAAGCTAGPDLIWDMKMKDTGNSIGLGLRGKPMANLQVGANLQWTENKSEYPATSNVPNYLTTTNIGRQGLPDITTKLTTLSFFGLYALEKNADVRLDLAYQRYKSDDWSWNVWNAAGTSLVPFKYMDGTTVNHKSEQSASFVGARYIYKFF